MTAPLPLRSCPSQPHCSNLRLVRSIGGHTALDQSDSYLAARIAQGDQDAARLLYVRHIRRVQTYFERSGFCGPDADDLSQQTFIRAFRALPGFDAGRAEFRVWLGAVARNVARRQWGRRNVAADLDPELAEQMFASTDNPGTESAFREQCAAVADCVKRLDEPHRTIITLRYVEGLSTRAIAGRIELAESTVRLRLTEAMGQLQRCLGGKGILGVDE